MSENAVEEVREFLDQLPQRSPQEAIGMRDEGGLMRGLILGTAGLGVLVMLGTIIPFVWEAIAPAGASTAANKANKAAATSSDSGNVSNMKTDPANEATASGSAANVNPSAADIANPDRVLDSLGIGEAKEAAPNVNPRETDLDNLLDGVK